jgi:hypothetical protein
LINPYPIKEGDKYLSFEFVTAQEITYRIYFLECSSFFEHNLLMQHCVFTFNIKVVSGNPRENGIDRRIADTIFATFRYFFKEKWYAVVYSCDPSDSRQLVRKETFDRWFNRYNDGSFIKGEFVTFFGKDEHYNSMILRADNPLWADYLIAFDRLSRGFRNKPSKEEAL